MENLEIIITDIDKKDLSKFVCNEIKKNVIDLSSSHFYCNEENKDLSFEEIFDVVKVNELPTDETEVKVGDLGSVIMVLDDDVYEVEFVNNDGRVYETLSLKESQLAKID